LLIIFDLDDTLIQTSRYITPWRFEKILHRLASVGALKGPVDHYLDELVCEHQKFESSLLALSHFFEAHQIDTSYFNQSVQLLNDYDQTIPVVLFEGVKEFLERLKLHAQLVCVTLGVEIIQRLKLQKSGLSEGCFKEMYVVETGEKGAIYQELFNKYPQGPVFVVGDRVVKDLVPAKKLGFTTVLVKQGRGQFQKNDPIGVDFVIGDVLELENLVKSAKNP
jgi:FMN phosphatase YigB (HAD superfamily)